MLEFTYFQHQYNDAQTIMNQKRTGIPISCQFKFPLLFSIRKLILIITLGLLI
ncbi:hypothetical protein pb186bvf_018141 [Paramecium bursaria]